MELSTKEKKSYNIQSRHLQLGKDLDKNEKEIIGLGNNREYEIGRQIESSKSERKQSNGMMKQEDMKIKDQFGIVNSLEGRNAGYIWDEDYSEGYDNQSPKDQATKCQ